MQITLTIPDVLIQTIKIPEEEISARLHVELAIRLYKKKLLNLEKLDLWQKCTIGIFTHY